MPHDLTFLGAALVDSILRGLDPTPVSATGYRAESGTLAVGGEAVNGSITAARLGLRAKIFCSLGRDLAGDLIAAALDREGVDASAVLREDRPTPVSTLLVREDGTRRSVTTGAHRYNFHPERYPDRFSGSRALVLGSLFRAPFNDPEVVRGVVTSPAVGDALLLADTKLPNFQALTLADLRESLPYLDYIFPNEDEALYCTGRTDREGAAAVFLSYGIKNVIVKLGAKGCFFKNSRETYRLDAFSVPTVDATGAGDSFLAGFAAALLTGADHPAALRFATACGALCTTALGATGAVKDRGQVEAFLASRPDPIWG